MRLRFRRVLFCCLFTFLISLFLSVYAAAGSKTEIKMHPSITTETVVLMPFLKGSMGVEIDDSLIKTLDCSMAGLCILGDPLDPGAEEVMTQITHAELRDRLGSKLLAKRYVDDVFFDMEQDIMTDTPRSIALRLADRVGADHVVIGNIWKYRDKMRDDNGEPVPASISFALYLVRVEDEKLLWHGEFIKTQQTITEDILQADEFLKYGVKWVSVEELAVLGVEKVFEDFPIIK